MSIVASLPPASVVLAHARERSLPALIAELGNSAAPTSARLALLRALRADLAQMTARPELVPQLLYRRLARFGVVEGSLHAIEASTNEALRAWLEALVREAKPDVWLRSLRTCAAETHAGLVHEYVGDFDRYGVELAFVGDGSAIAISSRRGLVAWSYINGARLASITMPKPHRWCIDVHRPQFGGDDPRAYVIDRETNDEKLAIPALELGAWSVVRALPSLDGAIVAGWVDDYEGVVARYDRTLGAVRARWSVRLDGPVYAMALSADGSLLAVSTRARVVLMDPRDGAVRGALSLSRDVTAVALSFDNERLATATESAVCVWDLRSIPRDSKEPSSIPSELVGRVDAQFDARSQRVLMGGALCDTRTGALVAALPLDAGNYLEGGPPERAAGIFGDRVIEVGFSVRAFSLENGSRIATAKLGPFAHWHFVRVAPDGRSLAWGRRDELVRWRWCSIETGEVLREFVATESPATSFEFAPNGRMLASAHRDGAIRLWDLHAEGLARVVSLGGELQDCVWSIDSDRLVVAVRGEGLVQIDGARGEIVARHAFVLPGPFDESDLARDQAGAVVWSASTASTAALHGWSGFRSREHAWSLARDVGGWRLCDDTGERAFIASATMPVIDPTGRFVATREELYAIEALD